MRGEAESTRAVARVVGPTLIAAGLFMLVRRKDLPAIVDAFVHDNALATIAGLTSLVAGLVLLTVHNRISTLAALVLTLLGFAMVIRGAALLFAPWVVPPAAQWLVGAPHALDGAGVAIALVGAWISTVGFSARPPPLSS
jgi:cytochrome bd-type quinol oxidase subunit 2